LLAFLPAYHGKEKLAGKGQAPNGVGLRRPLPQPPCRGIRLPEASKSLQILKKEMV